MVHFGAKLLRHDGAALVDAVMAEEVEFGVLESLGGALQEVEFSVVVDLAHDAVADLFLFFHYLGGHRCDVLGHGVIELGGAVWLVGVHRVDDFVVSHLDGPPLVEAGDQIHLLILVFKAVLEK